MRIYQVGFAHVRYGLNWSSRKVAVRGFAQEAIKKALKQENGQAKLLRIEEVKLLAST